MDESAHEGNYEAEGHEDKGGDQDEESDSYSEASDESDGVVDPGVQEDMRRLEGTFKGIKERFRLINRIGEGMYYN